MMFSLARRIWNSYLFSTLVLLPSRFLDRVSDIIRLFIGVQEGKTLAERVIESNIPTRAEIQDQDTTTIEEAVIIASNGAPGPVVYSPTVDKILNSGSTSIIGRLKPGVVLKSPRYLWWGCPAVEAHNSVKDIRHSFNVEEQILRILGDHPRIIKFLGSSEDPRGLLFVEANHGSLQAYLDHHNHTIDAPLRMKWRTQAAEAIRYIHQKGVIHSDLRPENYLLHTDVSGTLNLYLSDFGGSTCGDIDGGHLPDAGFFNPRKPWVSTEDTDIFSLGSVFYTIMTGHWPYKMPGPFESVEDKWRYEAKVDELFSQGKFPTVEGLAGGAIIHGCWTEQYKDVGTILADEELLLKEVSI